MMAPGPSFRQYALDLIMSRIMLLVPMRADRVRTVELRDGTRLSYRRNRGDIYVLREVWIDRAYELPPGIEPRVVLDLGAHIGLVSLWLWREYRTQATVAVEPSAANANLAAANFAANEIDVRLVHAAVGPTLGRAFFSEQSESQLGQLAERGDEVDMVTIESLLESFPDGRADLVKIDIEGAERHVLESLPKWAAAVDAIAGEFHESGEVPTGHTNVLEGAGFRRASTHEPSSVECFVRAAGEAPSA
jgi:FkbM family methyltransferase